MRVGADDANDGPGECPGHVFDLVGIHVTLEGGGMEHECRSCGARVVRLPGWTVRGETAPGLDG